MNTLIKAIPKENILCYCMSIDYITYKNDERNSKKKYVR